MNYWTSVLNNPDSPEYSFAKKMVDTPKIVFSKTHEKSTWVNTVLSKENLADEIADLKKQAGKDIIVYGGANFVTNLINENLIDELILFVNPSAIGKGMRIFTGRANFKLIKTQAYDCGIVVNTYLPQNQQ